jgi:superfamily II DNA or RNA helicase
MAEAMHLFRNLRQWFIGQDINRSSTLVSDYRFIRQKRRYPTRNISLSSLLEGWNENFLRHSSTVDALKSQVGDFKLSGFQSRATREILAAWDDRRQSSVSPSATIVCAGTGSGKTMAFYLPALSSLATDLFESSGNRVRILAIYPRRELLKDQFSETWQQARKLDVALIAGGARKIRIGAFFSEIAHSSRYALKKGEDFLSFKLLKCATDGCKGDMRWSRADIEKGLERLVCNLCGHEVGGDEIALSRESAARNPPDILFTTTESLNQRMTDSQYRHLFGVGAGEKLPLVLLDEVHTYGGTQGAQTGLLLRRWTRLTGHRPHFVGLSATLRDAASFFATLTGVNRSRVTLVEPSDAEMEEEGAEYLLALRGDPVSQTALLSTTIQTAMLTRRVLDSLATRNSDGVWGSKTFVFTDDLDANNRLFSQLADAEGWHHRSGRLEPNATGPLAQLRNVSTTTVSARSLRNYGQDWSIAKACGFSLDQNDRARVARTSSQDAGYDESAEVVVATASLEVGFNDPDVGAVMQHKAPRDVASYLQRKGRAGRQREMRPWMIVVLSDFGRDRVTYQQYENLIDPQINLQSLPVDNAHIQKMQAAQAVLDWLSTRVPNAKIWTWMSKPQNYQSEIRSLLKIFDSVLQDGTDRDRLKDYIGSALQLSEACLNRILWQTPRSIYLEFIPTLRRRLSSNWAAWSSQENEVVEWAELPPGVWHSPVPDFIPDSSFADLDTPDLQVRLTRRGGDEWEGMSFFHGLKEFAPGRISKRFAVSTGAISDWLIPEAFQPAQDGEVIPFEITEAFGPQANLIAKLDTEDHQSIDVYQPERVLTSSLFADRKISDKSNAFLRWTSVFLSHDGAEQHDLRDLQTWSSKLESLAFFTHGAMCPVELIRYNTGSDATTKFRDGRATRSYFEWKHEGRNVAIGTRMFPDAVRFNFCVSDSDIRHWMKKEELARVLRAQLLHDRILESPLFVHDKFTANWVFECYLAAIVLEADGSDCEVQKATENVCAGESSYDLEDIPKLLFQLDSQSDEPDDIESEESPSTKEQKLQQELKKKLASPEVRELVRQSSDCLFRPLEELDDFAGWVRLILANTLCAALKQTLCMLLPNVDELSIRADKDLHQRSDNTISIWLSEAQSGGIGVVAQFQELYCEDPVRFLGGLLRSLKLSDYERIDADLYDLLKETVQHGDLADVVEQIRKADSFQARLTANGKLRDKLLERGFRISHTFLAVLHSRILKEGSNAKTDSRLFSHLSRWREIDQKIGIEVPMHIAAFAHAAKETSTEDPLVVFRRACEIQGTLWTRGSQVRRSALNYYNEFDSGNARTERILGAVICEDSCRCVEYDQVDWLDRVHKVLDEDGQVDLQLDRADVGKLPGIIADLHINPMDVHGLQFFPRIRSVEREFSVFRLRVELAEVLA